MQINPSLKPVDLTAAITHVFELAGRKVRALARSWDDRQGTPVFTVNGRYTSRGWTQWTQGFVYGNSLQVYEATGKPYFLNLARKNTVEKMADHVTHIGVHDHGFNNLSTYGHLRRLMLEGKIKHNPWEKHFYELAIKASAATQAARWTNIHQEKNAQGQGGYIYSFNGPHSLFVDTMRTIRILGLGHQLGHVLMGENDQPISLLGRSIQHALTTARYIVFDGQSQHTYDVRGRTAHEAIFNCNDGHFRCRGTQQGYAPFSTWTRGLAWAMLGYAEQLEYLQTLDNKQIKDACGQTKTQVIKIYLRVAKDTSDHYIDDCSAADGITYWDDGAPGLANMPDWRDHDADPFNSHEPVDASASAIAAQGLIRLGHYLGKTQGKRYTQAGLTVAARLMSNDYLATASSHQGLLRHSIYHQPNGWDHIPKGQRVACNESSMWGDYHLLELANLIRCLAGNERYPTFFA